MGGLARRATFLKQLKAEQVQLGVPVVLTDAGGILKVDDNPARSRAMIQILEKLGPHVLNLTPGDAHEMERTGIKPSAELVFVTANVAAKDGKRIAAPFHVMEFKGAKVAFTGISEASGADAFGYRVEDPAEALKALLPEMRKQADTVVVLAFAPREAAADLAQKVPGLDVIVSGYLVQILTPPQKLGNTWILPAQYEGKLVGAAGLHLAAGKGVVKLWPQQMVGLDTTFADDPEIAAIVERAETGAATGNGK